LAAATLVASVGCVDVLGTLEPPGGDDDTTEPPPPPDPPVPPPAVYRRGSLEPVYQLTPRAEYGRFLHAGVNMADGDFTALGTGFVSAAQKLDEIGFQIAQERGLPVARDLIPRAEDRQRAQQIPFRGNPSDVDFITLDGVTRVLVPLGGDLMTPGNEVAIATIGGAGAPIRVKVGVRPQRIAVHPAGIAFVCSQFSNYISVIDVRTGQALRTAEGPVEIATDYYCADLLLRERNPVAQDEDAVDLYVANSWRASVSRYGLDIVRDPLNDRAIDVRVVDPIAPNPENQPAIEITGVGSNPHRIALSEAEDSIYVANSRGGELARISVSEQRVVRRIALGAPSVDVVQIRDSVFVPTTMRDRGLLSRDEAVQPQQVVADPVIVQGLDGQPHQAHPGALFDGTRSYNFEDVRNGLFTVDFLLNGSQNPVYFTDDVSSEPNFVAQQRVLEGAIPQAIARNAAGDRIYVAMGGSDLVQELEVVSGAFKVRDPAGRVFQTDERPFAIALNEAEDQMYVATWGGERLEVFDISAGNRLESIDLGYAVPAYPATNMENGEYLFYNADWSNNGRKACATCHLDELLVDGIGFSNGATAPTAYHQVPPNFNLLTTDSYFWNGSFANGTYTSLAVAAQTRTNCELVLFGLIEGPSSDPNGRVGDPNNRVTNGQDAACRPDVGTPGLLPDNFDDIAQVIAAQKQVAAQLVENETGLTRDDAFRFVDFYSVSEMRLPPNPLKYLNDAGELDPTTSAQIQRGQQLFETAGCVNCHDPNNTRAPFTDGLDHGSGAEWTQRFANTYFTDERISNAIGALPQALLDGISASTNDSEINVHVDPIDYFVPFCFDGTSCLSFEDPLVVRGVEPAESDRLDLLVRINLADPDRGFVPGNVRGQPRINTSSLRGVWWLSNLLHHGHAHTVAEAILGPGHNALREGELGFAINALGETDVHGETSGLSPDDVDALVLYVSSIE
jgi:DNA-binding beta-propeller fold protein YncE/cytochrome c5